MAAQESDKSIRYKIAMTDVRDHGMSVREAAIKWNIPKSTLHDRLNGKVEYDRRSGPPSILTKVEENRLADWLIELAQRGFGRSKDDLLDAVKKLVEKDERKTPFVKNRPGDRWYRSFMKRNPSVRLRSVRPLDKKRAKISSADLDEWFAGYEKFVNENGLSNCPSQIWNCDESGFDLQGRAGKIVGPSATKEKPYQVVTGTKEHITVLPCFNACGQWMPPYILFAGKRIPKTYNPLEGGVPGSVYSVTEKGYMDTPTFFMWFANHFIPQLPPRRPVVLLVDSHESHIDLDTFELAKKNNIHIFALLKNATHLVQPADVGLFGAMKQTWYKHVRSYSQQNPNTDITKKNFCAVFKSTWEEVMRPSLLVDAFRKSGIFPIDRTQITNDQVKPSLVYASSSPSTASLSSPAVLSLTKASFQTSPEAQPSPTTPATESLVPYSNASVSAVASTKETASGFSSGTTSSTLQTSSDPNRAAFDALESTLETPIKVKYRRRLEEGYDMPGSPLFKTWKKLFGSTSSCEKENHLPPNCTTHQSGILSTPKPSASLNSSDQVTTSSRVSPALDDILVYPCALDNAKKRKNKVSIPNFMTSEASMKILLDEKLKKAREVAEKQKRFREREEKREAKKKEVQAKKKEAEARKKLKQQKTKRTNGRRGTNGKQNVSKPVQEEVECDENTCKICLAQYMSTDDEELPWVMCDSCNMWMHIECIPFGVDLTPIDNDEEFFCHSCI